MRRAGLVFVACLSAACATPPTNTGFEGRWERTNGAEVSIWEDEAGWHFCWASEPVEAGSPVYRCTEDGRTVMTERGEATYAYETRMTIEEEGRVARVEVVGTPLLEGLTPIRWTDRLELDPSGLALSSSRVALNGRTLDPPHGPMRLIKVANAAD